MKLSDEQLEEFRKNIKRDEFAAFVETDFRVNRDSEWFNAKLVEVSETKNYPRQESFRFVFLLPESFGPIQGSYLFEHPQLGTHEIFIVPVEHASDGLVFEAIFNRLLPQNQA